MKLRGERHARRMEPATQRGPAPALEETTCPPPRPPPPPPPGKPRRRPAPPVSGAWIWLVIGLALLALVVFSTNNNNIEIQYSSFIHLLDTNPKNIKTITFRSNRIFGELADASAL